MSSINGWASTTFSYGFTTFENASCKVVDQPYFNVTNVTSIQEPLNITLANVFLNIWDTTDSGVKYENQKIVFYANYTDEFGNLKDGFCNITILGSEHNMTKNTTLGYYTYNRTFASSGVYPYNITCDANDAAALTRNDSAVINDSLPPEVYLEYPKNNTNISYGTTVFYYNTTDATGIANCSFIVNNNLIATNSSVTMDATQNFTYEDMLPGYYNWSINCTDSSFLNNTGSAMHNLTLRGAILNLSVLIAPTAVYRNDVGVEFRLQVKNTGTTDATGNITMSLPYNWSMTADNESVLALGPILAGETVNRSWYVDIGNDSTLAEYQINFTGRVVYGLEDNVSTNVTVSGVNVAVSDILYPKNASCGYDLWHTVQANISSLGDNKSDVNISLFIDDVYNQTQFHNFSAGQWRIVNFSLLLDKQKAYEIKVAVDEPADVVSSDDELMHVYHQYLKNVSAWASMSVSGDYNLSIEVRNQNNCSLGLVSFYSFVPENINVTSFSLDYNATANITAPRQGKSYEWYFNMTALNAISMYYLLEGRDDYYMTDSYTIGIDPIG